MNLEDQDAFVLFRDHMMNPVNRGIPAEYSCCGAMRNSACGDEVELWLVIEQGTIRDAWHQVRGCELCKVSASMICERAPGMTLDAVTAISESEVLSWIGFEVTPGRRGCCLLPHETLIYLLQSSYAPRTESLAESEF